MKLATRVQRLARGRGCPLCGTGVGQLTISTNMEKQEPGAKTAEYERCRMCGRQVLVWFTIAIDRAEATVNAGDATCD